MQTWFIPLTIHIPIQVPIISGYHRRKLWQDRFNTRDVSIVAIYNTGRNLFFDHIHSPSTTHYDYQWSWLQFRNFSEPRFVLAKSKFPDDKPTKHDMIVLQLLGHDSVGTAVIRTRRSWARSEYVTKSIPAHHILYFAVKNGSVLSCMLVPQHLPARLFKTFGGLEVLPVDRRVV
jgi:hypothetical protein